MRMSIPNLSSRLRLRARYRVLRPKLFVTAVCVAAISGAGSLMAHSDARDKQLHDVSRECQSVVRDGLAWYASAHRLPDGAITIDPTDGEVDALVWNRNVQREEDGEWRCDVPVRVSHEGQLLRRWWTVVGTPGHYSFFAAPGVAGDDATHDLIDQQYTGKLPGVAAGRTS